MIKNNLNSILYKEKSLLIIKMVDMIYSNLAYILPILAILYEKTMGGHIYKNKYKFEKYYSLADCSLLILALLVVIVISTKYHECDNELRKVNQSIRELASSYERPDLAYSINNWYECKDKMFKYINLQRLDYVFAYTAICMILIMIVPMYVSYKYLVI